MPLTLPLLVGLALLLFAALHDAAFRTVPNTVSALIVVCGVATRWMDGDLAGALPAALLVFLAAMACWHRGWMGGADVKLLGAAALLVPPLHIPAMLVSVAIAGGALTIPYLAARRRLVVPATVKPVSMMARVLRTERRRLRNGGPLPYAVAIAVGVGIAVARGGVS